jgi:hypothetical protein
MRKRRNLSIDNLIKILQCNKDKIMKKEIDLYSLDYNDYIDDDDPLNRGELISIIVNRHYDNRRLHSIDITIPRPIIDATLEEQD